MPKPNTSGHVGVSKLKNQDSDKIYKAEIRVRNTQHYLGVYLTYEEAVQAREAAERKYAFQLGRTLNPPPESGVGWIWVAKFAMHGEVYRALGKIQLVPSNHYKGLLREARWDCLEVDFDFRAIRPLCPWEWALTPDEALALFLANRLKRVKRTEATLKRMKGIKPVIVERSTHDPHVAIPGAFAAQIKEYKDSLSKNKK